MNLVRKTVLKAHVRRLVLGLLTVGTWISVTYFIIGLEFNTSMGILWIIAMLSALSQEKEGTVQYWILPEFQETVIAVLKDEGFEFKVSDGELTLFVGKHHLFRKLRRFKVTSFAILKETTEKFTLDIPHLYEKRMDEHITPDMLAGGGRYYKKLIHRILPRSSKVAH